MGEFTAQDAIRPRWDPAQKGQAIRLFAGIGVALVAAAVLGWLTLRYFGLHRNPLLLLLAVIGPALTAIGAFKAAIIVAAFKPIAAVVKRIPFLIFLGGVASVVVLCWGYDAMLGYVDRIAAGQTEAEARQYGWFGADLAIEDIQSHLLTASEREANRQATEAGHRLPYPPSRGMLAPVAYVLWPFQFQVVRDVLALVGVVGFVSIVAMFGIWWERKISARMQSRLGPMRVGGWHGWAQSIADGLKLIQKEDILLSGADKVLFRLAPYLVFVPALAIFIALPFSASWIFRDLDVGLIFILAMVGIGVVGVILAGWASNNKWSVYGAMREACQMVSYEIPMGLSLLVPVMTVGTLSLTRIGEAQSGGFHTWLAFQNPFTFIAAMSYYVASLASCKRAPFDLPEAESELVSGYHTEYSGFRFSLFFFAEYAEMFAVSALATVLFFGAWHSPLPASWGQAWANGAWWQQATYGVVFSGPIWFLIKAFFFFYAQLWLRWTLPRIRLDQVMYACVQVMVPLAMVVLLGQTFWGLLVRPGGAVALAVNLLLALVGALLIFGFFAIAFYGYMHRRRLVGTLAVEPLPGS